jgi:hypothetical protein
MQSARTEEGVPGEHDAEREGIVMWDQKGLVVRWPDGHCSHFLWEALRRACRCPACQLPRDEQVGSRAIPLSEQWEWRLL